MNIKKMDNNQLFKAVVESQGAMKSELLGEIGKLRKDMEKGFVEVGEEIKKHRKETKRGFKEVNNRVDLLGRQLNTLDEDAPTGEDFNNLVKRVTKLDHQNFVTA